MSALQPIIHSKRFTDEASLGIHATLPDGACWQSIDGVAMRMAPPTPGHQRIGSNLVSALTSHFDVHQPDSFAYQEVGLIVPEVEVEGAATNYEA